jgi:DNA-binding transcriptional ArsR family regulator
MTDALAGIEAPEETGKFPEPISEIVFVNDPERAEILDEQVRYMIIQVLRRGVDDTCTTRDVDSETGERIIRQRDVKRYALSVVEIVKMSETYDDIDDITKNQVYHHLPKLIEGGYVVKFGTVTTGKRTTDYYRRTAKGFVLTVGEFVLDQKMMKKKTGHYIDMYTKVFDITITDDDRKELAGLMVESMRVEHQGRAKIGQLIKGDVADKKVLSLYEDLVKLYALGDDEWFKIQKRIRAILLPKSL